MAEDEQKNLQNVEQEQNNETEQQTADNFDYEKAYQDIGYAKKRSRRNALITVAGIAVFAAFVVTSGLTWGFTLPTLSFAASWGLLGAGVTWGVGFWANRKNRWLKKLQKQKQIQQTGKVQTRKGQQNVQTQAVAKNNKKLNKNLKKFSKTRIAKHNPALLQIFSSPDAAKAEAKEAAEKAATLPTRQDGIAYLSANIQSTLPTAEEMNTLDTSKIKPVDGFMQVESTDLLKAGDVTKLPEVKYGDEFACQSSLLRTLGLIKESPDTCFPFTISQYTNTSEKGKDPKYKVSSIITIDNAQEAEKLFAEKYQSIVDYRSSVSKKADHVA